MSAIFISHSSRDNELASELGARLKEQGHRSVFLDFDPAEGIPGGRDWEQELYQQLRTCQAVIVLCSEHSMASHWCFAEITHAKALGKYIFPIKIGDCSINTVLTSHQVLDLMTDEEDTYRRLWRGLKIAGLDPTDTFNWDGNRPPYPGLLAFDEEDAAIFFGRKAEIQQGLDLLNRLRQFGVARLMMVLGASGSGKSSLVRAGLLPRLRRNREQWLVVDPFRPHERPLKELAVALAKAFKKHQQEQDWRSLWNRLECTNDEEPINGDALIELAQDLCIAADHRDAKVLLVIDQAEELLGYTTTADDSRFLSLLRAALEALNSPLMVICTLRSDFLGDFQQHPAVRDLTFEDLRVGPMSVDSLVEVIEGPAEKAGLQLESGLTEVLVEDTETEDALPLLAFTMRELYERYAGGMVLKIENYREKLGGLAGSVAKAAEAVFTAKPLTDAEEAALHKSFLSMVRINEEGQYARHVALWADIPESVHTLLERFVQARLLVSRGEGGDRMLEVAHEALFRSWARLQGWLDKDREFLLWRKRLDHARDAWSLTGHHRDALLRGASLREAEHWLEERGTQLDREAARFVSASRAAHQLQRRIIGSIAAVASLVMLFMGAYAWVKGIDAQRAAEQTIQEAQRARASGIVSLAQGMMDKDPLTASLILTEVGGGKPPAEGISTARYLLNRYVTKVILRGHEPGYVKAGINTVAYSPDGTRIVTAGADGTVRLWETDRSGQSIVLEGHTHSVVSAEFSPNGSQIVSASRDGTARVWNADDLGKHTVLRGHKGEVHSARFSVDGTRIVTASGDGTARVWSVDGSGEHIVLRGHEAYLWTAEFSHDGNLVATGSGDHTVRVWRVDDTDNPLIFRGHKDSITAIAFSSNDNRIITGSLDRTARIWMTDDNSDPIVVNKHNSGVQIVQFSPDGTLVLTGSSAQEASLRVWQADGIGEPVILGDNGPPRSAVFTRDGKRILVAWHNWGKAEIWSVNGKGQPIVLNHGNARGSVRCAAFSPDERDIVTAFNNTAIIWTKSKKVEPLVLGYHTGALDGIRLSPDDTRVIITSRDGTASILNIDGTNEPIVLRGHTDSVYKGTFSPDSRYVLTASFDGTARLWRADGSKKATVLEGHKGPVHLTEFSPIGTHVLTVSNMVTRGQYHYKTDATLIVWEVDGSGKPTILSGHKGGIKSAFFSPNGQRIVTAGEDHTIRVWRTDGTGEPIVLQLDYGGAAELQIARFSPDGLRIVIAHGRTAQVWNADGSDEPLVLQGHDAQVNSVEFSPDGQRIVTASDDGTARVWQADGSGEPTVLIGHTYSVHSATFSQDSVYVVTSSWDGTARVWQADGTGKSIILQANPQARGGALGGRKAVRSAVFTFDGTRVVTLSGDNAVRVWTISWDELVDRLRERTSLCLSPEQRVMYLGETRDVAAKRFDACERSFGRTPPSK